MEAAMAENVKRAAPPRKAKTPKNPDRIRVLDAAGKIDIPMLVITLVLLAFGITMMFSAGHALSYQEYENSYAFATKQMIAAALGIVAMFLAAVFDYRLLRKRFRIKGTNIEISLSHIILAITLGLTSLTMVIGVSNIEDGPTRWLRVPLFGTFQPSDFLKVGLIIFMAYYIHRYSDKLRLFKYGMLRPMILFVIVAVIMISQPHLSGLVIMTLICGLMLVVGGINMKPLFIVGAIVVLIVVALISFSDFSYFQSRIATTFDPLADKQKTTYQSYQAILAVGSGGFWGVGFGNSAQKYGSLPEAQNDFVYAVL